jgi:hypothetical protein
LCRLAAASLPFNRGCETVAGGIAGF